MCPRVKLSVLAGSNACDVAEDLIKSGGRLEACHESALGYRQLLVDKKVDRILDTYS